MQNIKSNEDFEDFIAKLGLPKESLMKRSRFSISSKIGDVKRINKLNTTFCKDNQGIVEPLTDVSNRSENAGKPCPSPANQKENAEDAITMEAGSGNSVIRKITGSQMRFQGHSSFRRSLALPQRIQPICLSSKKKTPNRPFSASKSPRRPLLASRLKDPPSGRKIEEMMLKRAKNYNGQENNPPPSLALKSSNIISLRARRNMGVGIFSSTKKMQPLAKREFIDNLNSTKDLNQKKDQECCRTLQFQESQDTNDEEHTKPLPQIDLNNSKTDGSMLHGLKENKTAIQSRRLSSAIENKPLLKENYSLGLCSERKNAKGETFKASSTTIPVRINRRRSAIPVCKRDLSSGIKIAPLSNITENPALEKSNHSGTSHLNKSNLLTRRSRANLKTEPVPKIVVVQPNERSVESYSQNRVLTNIESPALENIVSPALVNIESSFQGNERQPPSVEAVGKSPPPPPNSPSCEAAKLMNTFVISEKIGVQPEPRSFKDASSNTILSASLFQGSYLGAEKLFTEAFSQQEKIEKESEMLVQEFKKKSEVLMMQYMATFEPFKEFRKQVAQSLNIHSTPREATLPVDLPTESKSVNFRDLENSRLIENKDDKPIENKDDKLVEDKDDKLIENKDDKLIENKDDELIENIDDKLIENKDDKLKIAMESFGTQTKNRLTRSVSHPPSPEMFAFVSPEIVPENSFRSVHSDSPFTRCVGDCERPSLPPMTPLTRLNVTMLKEAMNKQLQNLFE